MKRAATLALALVAGLLAFTGPASAAPTVTVSPDVANLPVGALPALPYVNWPAREIVDGKRHVSIAGIKARVTALHKVDGGYLLVRRTAEYDKDVVFVSNAGARRVLVAQWQAPGYYQALATALAVSHNGDKVIVSTLKTVGGERQYADTRVLSLPGGKLLRKRDFGTYAGVHAFGVDRALISTGGATRWWNPAKNTLSTVSSGASVESADLTAWEWALRSNSSGYRFHGIPPHASPNWAITQEDESIGPWSPDDSKVVGINEITDDFGEGTYYSVHRVTDGTVALGIGGNFPAQVSWESDTALLLRTRIDGADDPRVYQLIRCTLAGVCEKVGPSTTELDGVIIPATRRNS